MHTITRRMVMAVVRGLVLSNAAPQDELCHNRHPRTSKLCKLPVQYQISATEGQQQVLRKNDEQHRRKSQWAAPLIRHQQDRRRYRYHSSDRHRSKPRDRAMLPYQPLLRGITPGSLRVRPRDKRRTLGRKSAPIPQPAPAPNISLHSRQLRQERSSHY